MIFNPRKTQGIHVTIPHLDKKMAVWKTLAPKAFERGLENGIRAATLDIQARVKDLIDGPVLNRRTGRLWRSIHPEVFKRMGTVVGIVGTDVKYAAIHEFGGTIKPKGRFLVFKVGAGAGGGAGDQTGRLVMVKQVKIPKRPYMSRAFRERKSHVTKRIRAEVMRSIKGTLKTGRVAPVNRRRAVGFDAD